MQLASEVISGSAPDHTYTNSCIMCYYYSFEDFGIS